MKFKACLLAVFFASAVHANVSMFNAQTQSALQSLTGNLMSGAGVAPAPAAQGSGNTYTPDINVSVQVKGDIIKQLQAIGAANGMSAEQSQVLADGLQQADLVGETWKALEGMGYPRNSLDTATAYWILMNWDIVQGRESSPAAYQGAYRQIVAHFADNPHLKAMGAQEKQYAAEIMIWLAGLQGTLFQEAQKSGNSSAMTAAAQDARSALSQFGMDVDKLQLTDQGFIAR